MSYRIHTAHVTSIVVQQGDDEMIDEAMGYEDPEEDSGRHLILNDMGNMEAMVLRGSRLELRQFAERILDLVNDENIPFD